MLLTIPFNTRQVSGSPDINTNQYHTVEYGGENISIDGSRRAAGTIIRCQITRETLSKDFKLISEGKKVHSFIEDKRIPVDFDRLYQGEEGFNRYVADRVINAVAHFDSMNNLPIENSASLVSDFTSVLSRLGVKIARCPNLDCGLLNPDYSPADNEFRVYLEALPEDRGIITLTNTITTDVYAVIINPDHGLPFKCYTSDKSCGISEIIRADKNGIIQQKTSYHSDGLLGRPNKTEIRMKSGELTEVKKARSLREEAHYMRMHEESFLDKGSRLVIPKAPEVITGAGKIDMSDDDLKNMNNTGHRAGFKINLTIK